ncbi:MAG: TrkH family potassium uptake protein [Holosporales bacterium]|jgi:trk system potassium uptake protein TrkH|nr:TrkH family potassium uptake protein [Holosporales bacterium]
MIIPLIFDFFFFNTLSVWECLLPILVTSFVGFLLFFANKTKERPQFNSSDTFLLTTSLWIIVPFFAGLPFYFNKALNFPFIDAWFEAVSALTTTGFTIIKPANSQSLPICITMWRFILCYIGGMGMILMGIIIFPALRIGGMSLFRKESSEKDEKFFPRISQVASRFALVYTLAMVCCAILLKLTGVNTVDSICHTISAISTSGFSTYSNSILEFTNIWSEIVLVIAMILGGTPLLLFVKIWENNLGILLKDQQFKGYIKTLIYFSIIVIVLIWIKTNNSFIESIRYGILNTVSIITTTGFCVNDLSSLGAGVTALFFLISLIGGCTGSASGGIKIFRFQIIIELIKIHIMQLCRPQNLFIPIYKDQKITDQIILSVYTFITLYFFSISIITFILSLFNFDLLTSLSTATATIGNIGIGFGKIIGQNASISSIPWGAKIVLIFGMIFGRLELLTVLALFTSSFWRK